MSMMISQEFFDDVCVENADLLDLSNEQAVHETLQQLGAEPCKYLVQTFPSDDCVERRARKEFTSRLERVKVACACNGNGNIVLQEQTNEQQDSTVKGADADTVAQSLLDDLKYIQSQL